MSCFGRRCRRRLLASFVLVGCFFCGAVPAQASSFVSSLIPHLGVMWKIFYCLVGLFAILAIWELAVMIVLRHSRKVIVDDNGEVIAEQKSDEFDTGLINDATEIDPFQALINQASSDDTPVPTVSAVSQSGDGSDMSSKRGFAPEPRVPVFDGAATLPVGVVSSIGMETGEAGVGSGNPFRKVNGANNAEGRGAVAVPAVRPVSAVGSARPDSTKQMMGNAEVVDGGKTLVASAVVGSSSGVLPKTAVASSGPSKHAVSFAGTGRVSPSSVNPFGETEAAVGASRNSVARAVTPVGGGSGEDPWKKLLGQTSVVASPRREASDAGVVGAPRGLPLGARTTVGNSIKLGSSSESVRRPLGNGGVGASAASAESTDPWKALLGATSRGGGIDERERSLNEGRRASVSSNKPVVTFTKEELDENSNMRDKV